MQGTLDTIKNGVGIIKSKIMEMPQSSGVYMMFDSKGAHLYIGKAKNLPKRVSSYSNVSKLPNRLQRMVSQISKIEWIITKTEAEALLLEASLIKAHKPQFNIALKDDKSFPYIAIHKNHDFPRISKYRGKLIKGAGYYGPFASAGAVNEVVAELQRVFLIRPCSDEYFASRKRPCLQYQIKRCSAPCVGKIDKKEYALSIKEAQDFLSGKSNNLHDILISQMERYSENMEYEKAASLRDRIKILTQIQAKNVFSNKSIENADVVCIAQDDKGNFCIQIFFIRFSKNYGAKAYHFEDMNGKEASELLSEFLSQFYQSNIAPRQVIVNLLPLDFKVLQEAFKIEIKCPKSGALKDLVEFAKDNTLSVMKQHQIEKVKNDSKFSDLATLLNVKKKISRIEVYDNSHTYGFAQVGCMVTVTPRGFDKNSYRIFNIKDAAKHDDYGMLREVLTRRLKGLDQTNYPDIMVIDGGKGQLSVACDVVKSFGVDDIKLVAVAKGENRNAGREVLYTDDGQVIKLPKDDEKLHFIQFIRNEVHRFAITSHRKKRDKEISKSGLDKIPGLGPKRKKDLLNHFGSLQEIRNASVEDLIRVNGISAKLAKTIKGS